jgi:hypothetical protein
MTGTYRRLPISPPFVMLPGDTIKLNGSVIEQRRGTVIVATRTYTHPGPSYEPGTTPAKRTISEVYFFEETNMPGKTAVLVDASRNNATGEIAFEFSDGSQLTYGSLQNALTAVEYLDSSIDVCHHALILKTIRNSPDGANLENMVGAQFVVDFNADRPCTMIYPE